uniref:Uncharacterized protein n=1 Tax=Opuntia streptacantha TaxID=393608 RepID=A0A7C9DD50_OPUST
MKPLEPKPPDPCLLAFPALSWDPPNHDSSLNLLWAETRSQSCSNCSDVDGYSLSCSDLVCNRVGICCASVLAHRQARLLKAKPLKPSIAFIVVLIAPFESVGRVFDAAILFSFNVEESPMCMGSCCCPEPSVAKGQLLLVSFLFRLLGFRSEFKVRFLLLFPFPFWAHCCHSLHLGFIVVIDVFVISLTITQEYCVIMLLLIPSRWICSIILFWRSSMSLIAVPSFVISASAVVSIWHLFSLFAYGLF